MKTHPNNLTSPSPARSGFTILELLVVIAIILIAVVAVLPSIGRLIESQNYAGAINQVTATLGSARTRAVEFNRRVGVVFLWDARDERASLLLVEQVRNQEAGILTNQPVSNGTQYCEVFVPVDGEAPIDLPKGVGVFGLTSLMPVGPEASIPISNSPVSMWPWHAGDVVNGDDNNFGDDIIPWTFPRSDPRVFTTDEGGRRVIGVDPWDRIRGITTDPIIPFDQAVSAVRNVTTFFIAFGPDGSVTSSRHTGGSRYFDAYLEYSDAPIDTRNTNDPPYDDPQRFDPETIDHPQFGTLANDRRARNPEVVMRPVEQLAVVDLARMAEGVGIARPWLVRAASSEAPKPQYLQDLGYFNDNRVRAVSRWIDLNAEVISFNRYTGNITRRNAS